MGKKKDKKASKKAKKVAIKEAKNFIKGLFDKSNQGQPLGGVGLLIIPIGKPEDNMVQGPFEGTVSLGLEDEFQRGNEDTEIIKE